MTIPDVDILPLQRLVTDGAHEVRSQLAVILLELGKINHPGARSLEGDIQTASNSVNRIATLFRLMGNPAFNAQSVDIAAIVRELVQRMQQASPERAARIETAMPSAGCTVAGHRAFIAEALHGLLDNAIRHNPPGTQVVIRADRLDDSNIAIVIDDAGIGLAPAVIAQFAMPFVHGRDANAGIGLGLAMSRQIARLHGGDLNQTRSPLGGTRMTLSMASQLPVAGALLRRQT
jgi:two-component system, OmpR family, sensor histidine kinase QseC